MSGEKLAVTFYHSVICPRCQYTGIALRAALQNRNDVEVTKVEFLTHRQQARDDGVKSIPALVARGRSLAGFVLTRGKIERFLDSLPAEAPGNPPGSDLP
jgi:hypothetical protein